MLKLYVIRHGKAVKSTKSGKDFDRELNVKGVAQINQIGESMKAAGRHKASWAYAVGRKCIAAQ